jgi:CheY-like chemotaxis protein
VEAGTEPSALVLVIEDDADLRDGMRLCLEQKQYTVTTAADGLEALALLRGGLRPCLILLDLMMPKVGGFGFRRAQMDDPALADIPVVVFSGRYDARVQSGALGAAGYLQKPIDPDQLLAAVEQHRRK